MKHEDICKARADVSSSITGAAHAVLTTLMLRAGADGLAFPSRARVARESGASLASVSRALRALIKAGEIAEEGVHSSGAKIYRVVRAASKGAHDDTPGGAAGDHGEPPPVTTGAQDDTPRVTMGAQDDTRLTVSPQGEDAHRHGGLTMSENPSHHATQTVIEPSVKSLSPCGESRAHAGGGGGSNEPVSSGALARATALWCAGEGLKRDRAACSDDWRPSVEGFAWAEGRGFSADQIETHTREFASYWADRPETRRSDWESAWRQRLDQIAARLKLGRPNAAPARGVAAALEEMERRDAAGLESLGGVVARFPLKAGSAA